MALPKVMVMMVIVWIKPSCNLPVHSTETVSSFFNNDTNTSSLFRNDTQFPTLFDRSNSTQVQEASTTPSESPYLCYLTTTTPESHGRTSVSNSSLLPMTTNTMTKRTSDSPSS